MNMLQQRLEQRDQQQRQWFQNLLVSADVEDVENKMEGLQQLRKTARESLNSLPALGQKQEAWRYNRVHNIFKNTYDPRVKHKFNKDLDIYKEAIKSHDLPLYNSYRLVFINGQCEDALSDISGLPEGVMLNSVSNEICNRSKPLSKWFKHKQHNEQLFSALNNALFNDGVYLHLNPSVKLDLPIDIIYINTNQSSSFLHEGSMIQTHNIIDLDEGASASLVEHFISSEKNNNEKYFLNNLTEINLAEGSKLQHTRLQDESRLAHHLSSLYVTQKSHSHYYSTNLAFGSGWVKTSINVEFKGEFAECDLHGLYTVGDQQMIDFHLDVKHDVPSCRSREQFKGILHGKGRAVFDGRILVEKNAQYSDAALTNDNLLLVRDAEVDTKPQLEIYADDVKCSHGTTVGRLDQQQLFYLRSRGISEDQARKLLCQGFASDIVESIELVELRQYATEKISSTLNMNEHNITSLNIDQVNGKHNGN